MIRGIAPLLIVLAVAVAACGGAAPPAGPQQTASGPAPSALPAGTYTSTAFQPPVTFTVPDGWEKVADTAPYLQLRPLGSDVAGIHLFRDAVAASQDAACPAEAEPGVGRTSTELVAWLRARPGLVVSTPAMATVGGLRGLSVDVAIKGDWTESCPFANGAPTVPLIWGGSAGYRWIIVGNERLRMYVLDLPDGGTVIVDVDAFEGSLIDALIERAVPIIRSFQFKTG